MPQTNKTEKLVMPKM